MKVLSLFDGISCARVALERAGIPVEVYFASEVDKYAILISQKNYPDIIQLGDVKEIQTFDKNPFQIMIPVAGGYMGRNKGVYIGQIDILVGGSPCQDLSIAKKNRKGLDGERSGLFWEYVRILREVKPHYFILENVASMPKEAKEIITKTLGVEPIMINASLVSAQNRKRLFWVGKFNPLLKSYPLKYETVKISQPEDKGILLKDMLESGDTDRLKSYCIDASYYKGTNWKQYIEKGRRQLVKIGSIGKDSMGNRVYSTNGISKTLSANGGGWGAKTGLYAVKIVGRRIGDDGKRKDYDYSLKIKQRVEINENPQKTNTLSTVQKDNAILDTNNFLVRKLTPIECERLQGLPDNYTEGISNTQRYKCLGNAFNVDVIAHILSFIKKS